MKTQYLLALLVLLLPKQAFKYAACRSLWFHFVWKERHLFAVKGNDVCIQATLVTHPKNLMQKISKPTSTMVIGNSNSLGGLISSFFKGKI